jgi:hypothetical protein
MNNWTATQRANVEAARDAGVNLAFFSGNEMFWKTRWEDSRDASNTPYRTLVTYKETKANTPLDPADPPTWTGTWRDPSVSPPADGGRPENAVMGTIFSVNRGSSNITVPAAYSKVRIWRNTAVASLTPGQSFTLGRPADGGTILGYEWDSDLDNGFRPAGLMDLPSTTVSVPELLVDNGNTFVPGTATHHLTLYRIAANTSYVASYHMTSGNYAADGGFFTGMGIDSGVLHALSDSAGGGNGVFTYGASTVFPNQSFDATNYWVDVVFKLSVP